MHNDNNDLKWCAISYHSYYRSWSCDSRVDKWHTLMYTYFYVGPVLCRKRPHFPAFFTTKEVGLYYENSNDKVRMSSLLIKMCWTNLISNQSKT